VVAVNRALVAGNEPHVFAISSEAADYAIAVAQHIAVRFGNYVPLTEYDGGITRGDVVFCHGSVAKEMKQQTMILLEIIGNPFRPITLDPAWRTPGIVQLAWSLHEDRRFEDLPVLADALEEAGCREQSVLDHLRGPGPHVRGCWVLDLILGRA
jgi:hypothetical protein